MRYRTVKILAAKSLDAAGTETISIKVQQPLSRIELYWQITAKNAAGDEIAHSVADLTKIELVDGSDVLFSLNGYEAMALNIYDRRIPTRCHGQHKYGESLAMVVGIDFGRYLWDEVLALDPTKFTNLQLKITYTLTSCDEDAEAAEMEVVGYVFDEKVISPIGFLMSKEHYSYTPSSTTAYNYVDLPLDYPIRKLLVRGFTDGFEPWQSVSEVRLDEDNEKRVPFDWDVERYYRMMKGVWLPVSEVILHTIKTTGTTIYVTCTDFFYDIHFYPLSGPTVVGHATAYRGGKLTIVAAVQGTVYGGVSGYMPNHCLEFPFGAPNDMEDWYDVTTKGSVRLRLKAGGQGTSASNQIVLQQLRRY